MKISILFPENSPGPLTNHVPRWDAVKKSMWRIAGTILLALLMNTLVFLPTYAQLQQSGGNVIVSGSLPAGTNVIGHVIVDTTSTTAVTQATGTNLHAVIDSGAVTATISGSISNTAFGVSGGTANIGLVRVIPSSCTQSTNFTNSTAQVATGAGTTVTSTTTCVTYAYANNITNSPVTLRIADKQGSPVIWLGGNNDFTIPANSNLRIPIDGVTFTSGITAIAGTSTAINLIINGLQ